MSSPSASISPSASVSPSASLSASMSPSPSASVSPSASASASPSEELDPEEEAFVKSKRKISKETRKKYKHREDEKIVFKGFLPLDEADCDCKPLIKEYWRKVAKGKSETDMIRCPRKDKIGYNKYSITCANCGVEVAEVFAKSKALEKYGDLHYVCKLKVKKNKWIGCMALNLSPIDGKIGIECSCGQDTRDFRANNTLPKDKLEQKIIETMQGRDFGLPNSKFIARKV